MRFSTLRADGWDITKRDSKLSFESSTDASGRTLDVADAPLDICQ